jgi:hypothetical protein
MTRRKYTCNDQQVPRQATGKTPVRNLRIPDERWLPALAKAEAEGRTLTDVIDAYLGSYIAEPIAAQRQFTLARWPEVTGWAAQRDNELLALSDDLAAAVGPLPAEWIAVAVWLAVTHHPGDPVQQNRIVTGHIMGRAVTEPGGAYWRDRYRDSRQLSQAVQAILEQHLPRVAS